MAIVTGGLGNVSVYRLKYSWKVQPTTALSLLCMTRPNLPTPNRVYPRRF